MLDFGFSEILLTSAIALVVLGPERLPKVARKVGNWMGRARLMARQLSEQLEREVNAEELLRESAKPVRPIDPPALSVPTSLSAAPSPAGGSPPPVEEPPPAAGLHADAHTPAAAEMHSAAPPAPAGVDPKLSGQ
ncbi:MAG: Sec-independent protein translocase protein TatB [Steroidobacteraceae bacterium]|jgi:sec-independent protein translocase protein TatB